MKNATAVRYTTRCLNNPIKNSIKYTGADFNVRPECLRIRLSRGAPRVEPACSVGRRPNPLRSYPDYVYFALVGRGRRLPLTEWSPSLAEVLFFAQYSHGTAGTSPRCRALQYSIQASARLSSWTRIV